MPGQALPVPGEWGQGRPASLTLRAGGRGRRWWPRAPMRCLALEWSKRPVWGRTPGPSFNSPSLCPQCQPSLCPPGQLFLLVAHLKADGWRGHAEALGSSHLDCHLAPPLGLVGSCEQGRGGGGGRRQEGANTGFSGCWLFFQGLSSGPSFPAWAASPTKGLELGPACGRAYVAEATAGRRLCRDCG